MLAVEEAVGHARVVGGVEMVGWLAVVCAGVVAVVEVGSRLAVVRAAVLQVRALRRMPAQLPADASVYAGILLLPGSVQGPGIVFHVQGLPFGW